MLTIRLQRIGKKNRPSYRLVVSEHKRDLYGRHNEILGNYDPVANPKTVNLKADRIKYWISVGAQTSATVHNLLVSQGVIEGKKVQAWRPKKKKNDKEKGDNKEAKTDTGTEGSAPEGSKSGLSSENKSNKEDKKPDPEEKKDTPKVKENEETKK